VIGEAWLCFVGVLRIAPLKVGGREAIRIRKEGFGIL
jgi:hypothetical protein